MTERDLLYLTRLLNLGKINGPVLELGAGDGGATCRDIIVKAGLAYYASDMKSSPGVDYAADFESENIETCFPAAARFKTIIIFSVLEHSFNPVRVLDNAVKLLDDGGSLILITPASWALHNYPIDCYRILPNWYERYADNRKMTLNREYFEYLGYGTVDSFKDAKGNYKFPFPAQGFARWRSRIVHRLFNTFGRDIAFPNYLAIAALLTLNRKTSDNLQ